MTLPERLARYEREQEFLCRYSTPEEDRHLFTPWKGASISVVQVQLGSRQGGAEEC